MDLKYTLISYSFAWADVNFFCLRPLVTAQGRRGFWFTYNFVFSATMINNPSENIINKLVFVKSIFIKGMTLDP